MTNYISRNQIQDIGERINSSLNKNVWRFIQPHVQINIFYKTCKRAESIGLTNTPRQIKTLTNKERETILCGRRNHSYHTIT